MRNTKNSKQNLNSKSITIITMKRILIPNIVVIAFIIAIIITSFCVAKNAAANDLLPVCNFDKGVRTDQNGRYNEFQREPSSAGDRLSPTSHRGPNGRSLRVDYNKAEGGFCGVWMHLFETEADAEERQYLDVRKFPFLSFWVRGEEGGEDFLVQMADAAWVDREDSLPAGAVSEYLGGPVTTEWQEVIIPVEHFSIDDAEAGAIAFNFIDIGSGIVYIDDVYFKKSETTPVPFSVVEKTVVSTPKVEVWNFDDGVKTNQEGRFNEFRKGKSRARNYLVRDQGRGAEGRCIEIDYKKYETGFCGIWFHLFKTDTSPRNREYLDLSGYPYLSFWVKGKEGGEDFVIQIGDKNWVEKDDSSPAGSVSEYLENGIITEWQQVIVPIDHAKIDTSKVGTLVFNFIEPGQGIVYIDDVSFVVSQDIE